MFVGAGVLRMLVYACVGACVYARMRVHIRNGCTRRAAICGDTRIMSTGKKLKGRGLGVRSLG